MPRGGFGFEGPMKEGPSEEEPMRGGRRGKRGGKRKRARRGRKSGRY